MCGVLGHLAPVHRCARSVRCVACAVSWTTWLLFTGVHTRCVVLCVRCPGPRGPCDRCARSACCVVCDVFSHLAPVHRCAHSVCCAVFCMCGVACAGLRCGARTRPSGWRLFVAGRGWVPSGRVQVHPDGGSFVACRGWVPSGRAHVHPDGGCFVAGRGWVSSGCAHVNPDGGCSLAGRGWVRCRARTSPSGRRLVLLGTCSRAVVRCVLCALSGFAAPGGRCCLAPVRLPWLCWAACLSGVPRGPAWCAAPRPVWSLLVLPSAFLTPWCLSPPLGLAPPALLGGCAGHAEAGREPGSLCLPLAPAEAGALGSLRVLPVQGPRDGVVPGGSPPRRSWAACAAMVGMCGSGH